MSLYYILFFITNLVVTFTIERLMGIFFAHRRFGWFALLLSYFSYYIVTTLANYLVGLPIISSAVSVVMIFFITLNYEGSSGKKCLAVVCISLFLFMVDSLTYIVFAQDRISSFFSQVSEINSVGVVAAGLIGFMLSVVLRRLKHIKQYNRSDHQIWLMSFLIPASAVYVTIVLVTTSDPELYSTIAIVSLMFLISLLTFYLLDVFYNNYSTKSNLEHKALVAEFEVAQRIAEERDLVFYANEIEQQYTAIRRLQHDHKNILLSLSIYIEEGDLDGLRKYFATISATTNPELIRNHITIEELGRIKVVELKAILVSYIIRAQNDGIPVSFESRDIIDKISMDRVSLVRIMGIILSNAIEELNHCTNGHLYVGCYRLGEGVTFVVENTCRPETPPIHEQKVEGFSTKGENRGMGLSILSELIDSHPNSTLMTTMENGTYMQKLRIADNDTTQDNDAND